MTYSLFDDLTTLSSEEPPTESIKYLILTIGHFVCSVKRNKQTLYHFVSRARDIANAINALIKNVNLNDESLNIWDNFDTYTAAVDPLEELLFDVALIVEFESTALLLPTPVDSIDICQDLITIWYTNRHRLRKYFEELDSESDINNACPAAGTAQGDRTRAQVHDDNSLLSAFCDGIVNHPLKDASSDETWIEQGKKQIKYMDLSLRNMFSSTNELMALGIKCAMLVYGVMEVATHSKDAAIRKRLRSRSVWAEAGLLLSQVISHLERKSPSFDELQTNYHAFVVFLGGTAVELPSAFMELKRCACRIRRPYFDQSVALISQCRTLVDYFNQHKTAGNVPHLKNAIEAAKKALDAAADAVTSIHTFDIETIHSNAAGIAFRDAEDKIKLCFDHYKLSSWDDHKNKMAEALDTDRAHLKQLMDRIAHVSSKNAKVTNPAIVSTSIQVIHDPTAPLMSSQQSSYEVESNTPLSAILWKEACENPDKRDSLLRLHKFVEKVGASYNDLSLNTEVGPTARTFYLVTK